MGPRLTGDIHDPLRACLLGRHSSQQQEETFGWTAQIKGSFDSSAALDSFCHPIN